jgi:hypothetical protein
MAELNSLYSIIYLAESIIAIGISLYILYKNRNYYLNKFFALIVFIFANYFFWESMIYFFPTDQVLVNLFKDISVSSSHISAYLFFIVSLYIWYGEETFRKPIIWIIGIIALIALSYTIFDEKVVFPIVDSVQFDRTLVLGHIISYIVPLIYLIIGIGVFVHLYPKSDQLTQKKVKFLVSGIIVFILAVCYFAVFRITMLPIVLGSFADLIGATLFTIGLIFVLLAFSLDE